MEGGAMPKLLHLLHDEDASCRTKALLALSCLIRLNPLALEVFRQKRGIPQLIQAADDKDIKVQRYCLVFSILSLGANLIGLALMRTPIIQAADDTDIKVQRYCWTCLSS